MKIYVYYLSIPLPGRKGVESGGVCVHVASNRLHSHPKHTKTTFPRITNVGTQAMPTSADPCCSGCNSLWCCVMAIRSSREAILTQHTCFWVSRLCWLRPLHDVRRECYVPWRAVTLDLDCSFLFKFLFGFFMLLTENRFKYFHQLWMTRHWVSLPHSCKHPDCDKLLV